MRQIDANKIKETVTQLCMDANYCLPTDVSNALKNAQKNEESLAGKTVFEEISTNQRIALEEKLPLCQDCGTSVFLLEIGQDVHITGGNLSDAINEGVKKGYEEGFLRKSVVYDAVFTRSNTGDNTPAVIHTEIVPGDKIKIVFCPKGGGCENMSALKMMTPADGIEGIKNFVVDFVKDASGNPCPPTIIGVGIGGTFEKVAFLAKKAVLRTPLGTHHPDKRYAQIERELLDEINNLGIGPMGFGGKITALAVHIETHPVHLAMMPVAINMNCHVARQRTVII